MSELFGTTHFQANNEPLTLESLEKAVEAFRAEYPEPPVEILSPQEYFRRLGYCKPIPSDWLARFMEEHRP